MGVMDKFLKYMRVDGDENDEYYNEYDDYEEPEPEKNQNVKEREEVPQEESKYRTVTPKITPMKPKKVMPNGDVAVCVIKPTSVDEAREITETLLANKTVVLNLEGLDVDIAQRIIDFTSGSCFAISGNLQKISNYIFIITPASVDVSGDFQDIISGSFNVPNM